MHLKVQPLNECDAWEITRWSYDAPYDFYNLSPSEIEQNVHYFLDIRNNFYGIFEVQENFVGYCSFGQDGQVLGGDYDEQGLDIGMGIRPELTGQGQGVRYVEAVLDFARQMFAPALFRVTIAELNQRAVRVWQKAGFHIIKHFKHPSQNLSFVILVREA